MSGTSCALSLQSSMPAPARTQLATGPCRTSVLALIDTREVSGPCRGLYQVVKLAAPQGVHVTIGMFARPDIPLPAVEETARRGLPLAVFTQRRRYDPSLVTQAWGVARQEGIRIIQSHGYKPACVAWCLRKLTGLPWVAFSHGYTNENRRIAVYNRLDRWLMRQADRVVVMSERMAHMFREGGVDPTRLHVIHNALDPEEYDLTVDGSAFRDECGAHADELVLGVIGRFSSEKGQAQFLAAFASALGRGLRARAALIGDGLDAVRLRAIARELKIADKVVFTGYRRRMSPVYAGLDLVVIPSLSEGLPNVLLEALYHRKPVVATTVGAIPDVLEGPLGRWLVRPGDIDALAAALADAAADPAGRSELARAGHLMIRERFSPDARVRKIIAVYDDIVSRQS